MKEKIKKIIYEFIRYDGITASIAAMVILVVFFKKSLVDNQQITIIDWTMFTSIVFALVLNSFSKILKKILMNRLEDSAKLTRDYEKLTSKYEKNKINMIVYNNAFASQDNLRKLRRNQELQICIPVICECKLKDYTIDIKDLASRYKLPDIVQEHFDELITAHSTSKVYNQLNIRVDDWKYENKKFIIKTSRTTYFDSLVTNRAMDFRWSNGLTIREQFEFGPYINTLKESCLSNHLGFNGFVKSSDNYIMFVKRGKKISIGKGTYGNSVNASLKTKYALNNDGEFTKSGLINGILHEINDELKIPKSALEEFSINKHLIAAYRDILEGGKPQLLFFIHSHWNKKKIEENFFIEKKKVKKRSKLELLEDGDKFLWIPLKEIKQMCIMPDMIIHQGKSYQMMPSATASIVMLIEYLK